MQPRGSADSQPLPTISRVHVQGDVDGTSNPFIDVVEAYWSPMDKGLTSAMGVLTWLLRALFVPLNTTAKDLNLGPARNLSRRYGLAVLRPR